MKQISSIALLGIIILFCACNGNPRTPKPQGYLRDDFPPKSYLPFAPVNYPYAFDYPAYAKMEADTQSYNYEPYWINIQLPRYHATIHISYKRVQKNLPALLNDTHNFVYRHVIKADAITETPFVNDQRKVYGMLYELGGDVASSVQFYVTDSTTHFLRGALYFMATPNKDSLAPSIAFLTEDIQYLMQTIVWK